MVYGFNNDRSKFDLPVDIEYPMPTIDIGSMFQYLVSNDSYSAQSACVVDGRIYAFYADSSNNLIMACLDPETDNANEISLSVTGHANTATTMKNGHILLSANGSLDLYEIDVSGNLISTDAAPCTDCNIAFDHEKDRYIGVSRRENKLYIFDDDLNLQTSKDFDLSFINDRQSRVALQNLVFYKGLVYMPFRPNSVYAVNADTLKFANMFRIVFSPSSEFEGLMVYDDKLFSIQHAYTERISTLNPVYAGSYMPYNGYNGELRFVNDSYIDGLWKDLNIYVDYDADNLECYGTSAKPFKTLTQAFERSFSYENVRIYLNGDPSHEVELFVNGTALSINAADSNDKPIIPKFKLSGIGAFSADSIVFNAITGDAITFKDKSNLNAHFSNCEITALSGTGVVVNWGNTVEIRNTSTINAQTAISSVNADVFVDPSSIISGGINNHRNSRIGSGDVLLSGNSNNDFTTKLPITMYTVVAGLIKTKVSGYNFYIPYVGIIDSNKLYASGGRYANVTSQVEVAAVEGDLSNNGTTFTRTGGSTDAVIYSMRGIY